MTVTDTATCRECGDEISPLTRKQCIEDNGYEPEVCDDCEPQEITEESVAFALQGLFDTLACSGYATDIEEVGGLDFLLDAQVQTYEQAGALTMNKGVWMTLKDGRRLQLTVHLG